MRRLLVFFAGLSIAAMLGYAAPVCSTGTYTTYLALGSTGCTIGDATFSMFSPLGFVNAGVGTLSTDEIEVMPGGGTLDPTLMFVYLNAAGTPTPVTVNQNGQIFSLGFNYQLSFTGGATLSTVEMDSTFTNTAPGRASATKTAQLGGSSFTSTVGDQGVSNPLATYTGPATAVSGTGTWTITDTSSLQAQTGGTASASSFENLFELSPGTTTTTPEPSTLALLGVGLIGLGWRRAKA